MIDNPKPYTEELSLSQFGKHLTEVEDDSAEEEDHSSSCGGRDSTPFF